MAHFPTRLLLVALVVAATSPAGLGQRRGGPAVGDVYPDLTLPSLKDGKPLSLKSFRGKKVLLLEFASW